MSRKIYGERWETIGSLSEGGQKFVYRVKDLKTDDENYVLVRLKKKDRKERFEREIEAVRSIDSPYVGKIIDFNTIDEEDFYFVMPYIEKTLSEIIPSLKGDFIRSLEIFDKICTGIEFAHSKKEPIIHRDLKPDNILIDASDNPVIIDFGLCFLDSPDRFTQTQEQVGSRFYMAPECAIGRSENIGPHTDIYSLGKILYVMISGGKIFPRELQNEDEFNLEKIIDDKRIRYLTKIINNCVKENTSERFNDVQDLSDSIYETIKLLEGGFMPVNYGNETCRFCGKGTLEELGTLKGSILKIPGYSDYDISSYGMKLWVCPQCGLAYIFKDDIYQKHKG